jgi:hypothetical protein
MIEKTTYMCEICGGVYSTRELAEACEKSGLPKDYDKHIGKWLIVPLQVFYHEEKETSSKTFSEVKWRLTRVDRNEIIGNRNLDVVQALRMERMAHKLKYSFSAFEDGCILIDGLFDQAIEITDEEICKDLVEHLVSINQQRGSANFEDLQHELADEYLESYCKIKDLVLPEIKDVEKYNFKNEVV